MARSNWHRPSLVPLAEGVRRVRMTVSYDGSAYRGWQDQKNGVSVESRIEEALLAMTGKKIAVIGSGRTDSGVHAIAQVCHFDLDSSIPASAFKPRLNSLLPRDIRIMESSEADGSFHARFTAMARQYRYEVKNLDDMTAFDASRVWGVRPLPPLSLLGEYASAITGTHDFTAFCSSRDTCLSKARDIYESFWKEGRDPYGFPTLTYTIVGNAFLYHMVRSLVGTMVDFALRGKERAEFVSVLEGKRRGEAGRTAPACGLYLERISYDGEEYRWFEEKEP